MKLTYYEQVIKAFAEHGVPENKEMRELILLGLKQKEALPELPNLPASHVQCPPMYSVDPIKNGQ
jgi:hypothetical protein